MTVVIHPRLYNLFPHTSFKSAVSDHKNIRLTYGTSIKRKTQLNSTEDILAKGELFIMSTISSSPIMFSNVVSCAHVKMHLYVGKI